jgi:hypothetical protein
MGHALMENRNGLLVDFQLSQATVLPNATWRPGWLTRRASAAPPADLGG